MQSKNIILAGVVGLDLSDASHAVFVAECTKGIENFDMFIEFCRDKKEGITYTTKTERFDILAKRFKKLEEAERLKDKRELGDTWTNAIVTKVSQYRLTVLNAIAHEEYMCSGREIGFRHLKHVETKELLFSIKELNALASVGNTKDILAYCEEGSLKTKLMASYMQKFKKQASYKVLGNGASKVMSLVAMSSEKMKG